MSSEHESLTFRTQSLDVTKPVRCCGFNFSHPVRRCDMPSIPLGSRSLVFAQGGEKTVSIDLATGAVTFGEGIDPDDASRRFWERAAEVWGPR